MSDELENHKKMVGSFIKNKLQEYKYYLIKLVALCELVKRNAEANITPLNTGDENINYLFNSLANTFQTLKDSLQTATGREITWAELFSIRHAKFIKESRNAITHDGMEVINACVDGKYYVAFDITRFDDKGKFITISAPSEDILTLSLQFTLDLMLKIEELITHLEGLSEQPSQMKADDVFKYMQNPLIPDFARKLFLENKEQIMAAIANVKINVAEEILKEVNEIKVLCS